MIELIASHAVSVKRTSERGCGKVNMAKPDKASTANSMSNMEAIP
jgi:hypothetical protein